MAENNVRFKKPTSAFSLYVQLYCMKRKGKSKHYSSFTEATKSWLTLSNEDKEMFHSKYNEYCEKIRKSYANNLKNIEPFLKQKKERKQKIVSGMNAGCQNEMTTQSNLLHTPILEPQDVLCPNGNQMEDNNTYAQIRLEYSQRDNMYEKSNMQSMEILRGLPEPIVPTIRTAKDVFDVVSTLHEGTNSNWESLSLIIKRRYQSAALALKKDYILKYKNYLESLPSQVLFDHYCIKSNECI